jgi:hypothetical protein
MKVFKFNEHNNEGRNKTHYQRLMECSQLKIDELKNIFYSIDDYAEIVFCTMGDDINKKHPNLYELNINVSIPIQDILNDRKPQYTIYFKEKIREMFDGEEFAIRVTLPRIAKNELKTLKERIEYLDLGHNEIEIEEFDKNSKEIEVFITWSDLSKHQFIIDAMYRD